MYICTFFIHAKISLDLMPSQFRPEIKNIFSLSVSSCRNALLPGVQTNQNVLVLIMEREWGEGEGGG